MIVGGMPVIDNYKLTTMDEAEILRTCQQFAEEIPPNASWVKKPEQRRLR